MINPGLFIGVVVAWMTMNTIVTDKVVVFRLTVVLLLAFIAAGVWRK